MMYNETIFYYLYHLTGNSLSFDSAVIFLANGLIFVMLIIIFVSIAIALYYKQFRNEESEKVGWWRDIAWHAVLSLGVGLVAWLCAEIIKYFVSSPRPFIALPDVTPLFFHGSLDSFPSGHATLSFAVATFLFLYHKKLGAVLLLLALIISLARVVAGVHWPYDILGGALLGIMIAFTAQFLTQFIAHHLKPNHIDNT